MTAAVSQDERRDALVGRALQSFQGTADVFAMYLGRRLGYYHSLWKEGAATSPELAARTGTNERYAREWFEAQDASDPKLSGRYDLVTIFEALHDMSRPVEVLRTARQLAGDSGVVLVVDERTDDEFTAPAGDLDRLFYGFSILVCLPDGMSHKPSAATGTVMRAATLRRYAREAGFKDTRALTIEAGFFRFYRLIA